MNSQHRIILTLSATLLALGCSRTSTQNIGHQNIVESPVITNYMSNQKVSSIAEDATGRIWIGTFRGLNRYNAHDWHQFYSTDKETDLPDNQVNGIFKDSKESLWICTVNGACRYTDNDNFKWVKLNCFNQNGYQFFEDRDGNIYLNLLHQLLVHNPETDEFDMAVKTFDYDYTFNQKCFVTSDNKLVVANPRNIRFFSLRTMEVEDSIAVSGNPSSFYLQKDGTLWLAGNKTISLFNTLTHRFIDKPAGLASDRLLGASEIDFIHPYGGNSLLISTDDNGFFLYNFINDTVTHQEDNTFPFNPPDFKVSTIFTDSQKNIWIGSADQGYSVIYSYKDKFNTDNYLTSALAGKSVKALDTDSGGNLWISTLRDGVYVYNTGSHELRHPDIQAIARSIGVQKIKQACAHIDDEDHVWLEAIHEHKVIQCSYSEGRLIPIKSYDMLMPMSFAQDSYGTIWIGSSASMVYAKRRTDTEFNKISAFKGATFVPGVLQFDDDNVWLSAFMRPIMSVNPRTLEIRKADWLQASLDSCILRSVYIPTGILKDSKDDVWMGTICNGLLRYSHKTQRVEPIPGTSCQDISSIEEDALGNIWISSQFGLSKYDNTTGQITSYYEANGLGGNQFYDRSSCRLSDGTLVFGGTHGITIFNPVDVSSRKSVPLLFEDLKIHNRLSKPEDNDGIDKSLIYNPDIHIKHNQNGFSISFAALDYSEHEHLRYFYRMDGFDGYWIDAAGNREAYYANLPAGKYTFRVKIQTEDVTLSENAINVIVSPAPWNSAWAWCGYILLALAIAYLFFRAWRSNQKEKREAELARQEKEQEKKTNEMNMRFFANISHEFRTPLTMIAGPVSQLCESKSITTEDRNLLHIVQRSVGRMLRLVNQLMDFKKLEHGNLKLKVRRTDVIAQLQKIVEIFRINATEKGLKLDTYGLEDSFLMWLDEDKLDKIVGNLMSNALKFTSSGGTVALSLDVITRDEAAKTVSLRNESVDTQYVKIVVTDTGKGIPENQLEKVFERYYQLDNQTTGTYNWGTGIGLYYARSLAVLHHGYLVAGNRQDGMTGASFTLLLPTGDISYTEQERAPLENDQNVVFPVQTESEYPIGVQSDREDGKPTVLVVDDDTEIVHYLRSLLSPHFNVVYRFDADSAFKYIKEEGPDIVMSDVVMPGKSGFELCRQIKEDSQVCHIPVVLVTAKATVENQVTGLDTGADAYVTKPFEPSYLIALIRSILKNRENVRRLLSESTHTENIETEALSPQDKKFMSELYALMESELSNPELDVAHMTERFSISRTKFYYKVKGLTGENPSVFFKTYKLNRAAELLKEGTHTMSEIADLTGFSTPSHFSTSFKKHFGVVPSEYK